MFKHPTYVVLEFPSPVADRILSIRKRYDPRLATFPAKITVAGSSGIGTLAPNQDSRPVFQILGQIAKDHLPIITGFTGISRFASGPVVWLQLADPAPLMALQHSLTASDIRFLPHKFPYAPHCSLTTQELAPEDMAALLVEDFPKEPFELSTLALYEVDQGRASLVGRFDCRYETNASEKPPIGAS